MEVTTALILAKILSVVMNAPVATGKNCIRMAEIVKVNMFFPLICWLRVLFKSLLLLAQFPGIVINLTK